MIGPCATHVVPCFVVKGSRLAMSEKQAFYIKFRLETVAINWLCLSTVSVNFKLFEIFSVRVLFVVQLLLYGGKMYVSYVSQIAHRQTRPQ